MRRYTATGMQIYNWYTSEFSTDPKSAFQKSIKGVRKMHVNAMNAVNKKYTIMNESMIPNPFDYKPSEGFWQAYLADMAVARKKFSDIDATFNGRFDANRTHFMTQGDFTTVQTGAFAIIAGQPYKVYIKDADPEDLEAFAHLWAVIGYYLGIDDKYNLAIQPNYDCIQKFAHDVIKADRQRIFYEFSTFDYEQELTWTSLLEVNKLLSKNFLNLGVK